MRQGRQTDKQADGQADWETDRQTERQTDRQTDRQTERQEVQQTARHVQPTRETDLSRQYKLPKKPCPISDVVVLVVLGEIEHVLTQQFCLLRVGDAELGSQVDRLQFNNVLLQNDRESFYHKIKTCLYLIISR